MSNIAVIYWSGTGNTKAMADAIAKGVESKGSTVSIFEVSDITVEKALSFDGLLLGCSSMGAEVLEESLFEPFYTALEGHLGGKKIALFGSYGWGDGQWMREWEERAEGVGAIVFEKGLIINEMPDAEGLKECEAFGNRFA